MKQIYKEIALQAGGSHYPEVGGDNLERFAQLLLEECISAVENTDVRHAYTTHDKDMIDSTIQKSIQSIRNKFDLPLIRKMPHEDRTMLGSTLGISGLSSQERRSR